MIVYRCLTSDEILGMFKEIDILENTIKGENTFKYDENTKYKHFFVFAEHADYYRKLNRRNYPVIGQYVIPSKVIDEHGFGFYGGVKTMRNNGLFGYYTPLPELIVNQENYRNEYLYKVESELYDDFVINKLGRNGNLKYAEPIEEYFLPYGKGMHGISGYLDYSYAEVYYEMVYQLARKNDMNMHKVVLALKNMDLHNEIESFFQYNASLFEAQTKKYLKRKKSR